MSDSNSEAGDPAAAATAPTAPASEAPTGASRELGSLASVMNALADAPGAPPLLAAGHVVAGKYRVERLLGRGGMGVVYLARELRLGRDVALKVGRAIDHAALARLEREAVLLASLSHPNVVTVYEVGESDGRLYLAMEHVAGGTARAWLAATPRTPREILALYSAAGDGLAAAHKAGLVHRDFKPDNVLVGDDGRPRVADFGLARPTEPDGEANPAAAAGDAADAGSITRAPLTRAGAIAGTPGYMAPEQRAGDLVDARADQYAFSASVWEALFGARPTPASPTDSTVLATPSGAELGPESAPRAPRTAGVSRHVVVALRRGLATEAAARWPSMRELVAELRRDPAARRRRLAIGAALAGAAAVAAVAITLAVTPSGSTCDDGRARVATTWNPARAASLGQRFAGELAAAVWPTVRARIDRVADALAVAHRDACRARGGDDAEADALSTRRTVCLAGVQARLEATIHEFENAPVDALIDASDRLGALPDLAGCSDLALANQAAVPSDPARRALVDVAVPIIARAGASGDAPNFAELARQAVAAADAAGWAPQMADAHSILAQAERDPAAARADYEEAIRLAIESGSDHQAAWALANYAWYEAYEEDGVPEPWIRLARAMWVRLGRPAGLGARVAGAQMVAAVNGGRPDEGLAAARENAELARAAYGDSAVDEAATQTNLASALTFAGHLAEARTAIDRAIALTTQALGEDHPVVGRNLIHSGVLALQESDPARAERDALAGFRILEAAYPANDPRLYAALLDLSGVLVPVGAKDARAILDRVIEAFRPTGGLDYAKALGNYAIYEISQGNLAHADELASAALAAFEVVAGRDALIMIDANEVVAYVERERPDRDLAAARAHGERALDLARRQYGEARYETTNARVELATTFLAMKRIDLAAETLAPAVAAVATTTTIRPSGIHDVQALAERIRAAGGKL